jgi:peroxiredoxin
MQPPVRLSAQLEQITANIPAPIGDRIQSGVAEIAASGVAPGLSVGDHAPSFVLPDAHGNEISVDTLIEAGPVVVVFYRGEWCPYCNLQLRSLQDWLPRYAELGASVVAISPQAPDHGLAVADKHALGFPVLSDLDQSVAATYKVKFTLTGDLEDLQVNVFGNDPATQNADGTRSLPVPATFVIDRDRVVRAAFVSPDWRVRAEPADIETALRSLTDQ